MIKLEEQLKSLPEEFTLGMEEAKEIDFNSSLSYILNKFDIQQDLNDLDEETKTNIILLFKELYIFGFYSGVSYTISPYDYLKDKKKEL